MHTEFGDVIAVPSGSLLHFAEQPKVVLGHVLLGGVSGKDIDSVKFVIAFPLVGSGASAGVNGDTGEGGLKFVEWAGVNGKAWPAKGVDMEASIECACFGMELGKDETYGAHRRVGGLPLFAAIVARRR